MAVLGTKLRVPSARRELVPRARLIERLHGDTPRLVLVSAPAGFGKTTLLSEWVRTTDADVAWVSLDAADNDLQRFLAQVLTVLRLGEELALTDLVNALDQRPGRTVLALDDYHVIEAPEVHEAVAFLIEHLPATASLAIASRADPPVGLARLRARGELLELRVADLRFTPEEAGVFLNHVMGLQLSSDQVEALEERTEGWAAGLQLAALSLRDHEDADAFVAAFAGSHRFVLDYLVEEVLRRQGVEVSEFLLRTAVLDRMTGSLCDALTGGTDGQQTLEELERTNLFIVALDDHRHWYRYHHLFADALRARLGDRATALHATAGRWYAEHELLEDAVGHALAADDPEWAADLIERASPELRRRRQDRLLRDWVAALPDPVVRSRAALSAFLAWTRLVEGDLDGLELRLQDAERALETAEDPELRAWIAIYRASAAQARGDTAGTATHARAALALAGPDDHLARSGGAGFLGLAAWAAGDLDTAVETFSQAVSSMHLAGSLTDALGATVPLADMWLARGQLAAARGLYERALAEYPDQILSTTGDLHTGLADVLREQGDLDGAEEQLRKSEALGEHASLLENRHRWFATLARVRRARGDLDGALERFDQAEAVFLPGFFPDVRPIAAARARVQMAQGDLEAAAAWARQHGVSADAEPTFLTEDNLLTLARLLIATGDRRGAVTLVERIRGAAEGTGRSLIEIDMVSALAHDDPVALSRVVECAMPVGYLRVFLDEGEPMQRLLDRSEHAQVFVRRPPSAEALSARELDVLRLLVTDLSGPEIAGQLYVSLNTLRTHTKHIFSKLDVNSRQAAVRRATELGLL